MTIFSLLFSLSLSLSFTFDYILFTVYKLNDNVQKNDAKSDNDKSPNCHFHSFFTVHPYTLCLFYCWCSALFAMLVKMRQFRAYKFAICSLSCIGHAFILPNVTHELNGVLFHFNNAFFIRVSHMFFFSLLFKRLEWTTATEKRPKAMQIVMAKKDVNFNQDRKKLTQFSNKTIW